MRIGVEALAEFIRSEMKKGERDWSVREVSRRASAAGYKLSAATITNILNGYVERVSEGTLKALAAAFRVPDTEVLSIYFGPPAQDEQAIRDSRFAALAKDAQKLTPENLPKYEALMEYVHHTVREMLRGQNHDLPRGKGKKT